jgi:sugar phosphate isomerase/epimerase
MKPVLIKSLWGMSGALDRDLATIADADYDGFEFDLPEGEAASSLRDARARHDLRYLTLIRTRGPDHLASFEAQLERAARLDADLVTSASEMDCASRDEALRFFEGALDVASRYDVPVAHETHRQTALFTPWNTAALLAELPELGITADYSHWCCVAERMLEDQEENLAACNARAVHIHGRVGFPGGPQVGDPRAPENLDYLLRHEGWWREIVRARALAGAASISFDPEFGPPPTYMPAIPFSGEPVADLWDVCAWMADRFRALVAEVSAYSSGPSR